VACCYPPPPQCLQSSPIGVPYGHRLSATCGKTVHGGWVIRPQTISTLRGICTGTCTVLIQIIRILVLDLVGACFLSLQ
jgi:hypothetical protein